MKDYIAGKIKELLNTENPIKIEIPPKDGMGDYSIQCVSLKDENHNNPIEIANLIKENFNDEEGYFSEIKIMGPYVNFYLNYDKFSNMIINTIEKNDNYG